jgi:hypothetical protein
MPSRKDGSLLGAPGKQARSCCLEAGRLDAPGPSSTTGAAACAFASASRRSDRALVLAGDLAPHAQAARAARRRLTPLGNVPQPELSLICKPSAPRVEQSLRESLRAREAGSGGAPHGVRARRPTASVGGGASGPRTDERVPPGRAHGPRAGCAALNDRRPDRLSRDKPGVDHFQPQGISRRVEDK